MTTENHIVFPLEADDPLPFVDYCCLQLVQAADVYQLNEILSAFLADDVIKYVEDNSQVLFVLSEVWNNTIRRVVFETDDLLFPDGLLMIPPLFEKINWLEASSAWNEMLERYETLFNDDRCLPHALALLFIRAMQGEMAEAMEMFKDSIERINGEEQLHAERYLENLRYFGWPELEKAA